MLRQNIKCDTLQLLLFWYITFWGIQNSHSNIYSQKQKQHFSWQLGIIFSIGGGVVRLWVIWVKTHIKSGTGPDWRLRPQLEVAINNGKCPPGSPPQPPLWTRVKGKHQQLLWLKYLGRGLGNFCLWFMFPSIFLKFMVKMIRQWRWG